jgi:hypothetical protein
MGRPPTSKTIGGLTHNERQKVFRLTSQMREAFVNVYMRLNDTSSSSLRSRTISARKMVELSRDLYRTLTRT